MLAIRTMRLPFFRSDDDAVSAEPKQDMRFFLYSKTEAAPAQASSVPPAHTHAANQSQQVAATNPVRATKTNDAKPKLCVEPEPETVRMQVPQGFSNMESAISFQLAYERGMSNASKLKLMDEGFDAERTALNQHGKQSGYNPYQSGYLTRKPEQTTRKKPTDLRALSKWIEHTRK